MEHASIRPENIVWIFGTARTGSTWLGSMMGELEGHRWWREPLVGRLFGEFRASTPSANARRRSFIMADATRSTWSKGIRFFVLEGAEAWFRDLSKGMLLKTPEAEPLVMDYLVVQEPNGSVGAPLLMEALPESRMILLVRDPRDVAASALGRHRTGGDAYQKRQKRSKDTPKKREAVADNRPSAFVKGQANRYLRNVSSANAAYDAHKGHKILVRYEDLRVDTLDTMRRIYADLDIPVDEEELARAVKKHAWESIPEEKKGEGKFYRKATPGGWREDLTPKQVEIVERITTPLLEKFYPG